jgi:uncharacterized repeat protein (TIGR01451 family)
MKHAGLTRYFGKQSRLILIAVIAVLVPVLILLPGSSAQNRASTDDKASGKKETGAASSSATNLPQAFRQMSTGPEPVSSKPAGFAVSRPLSQVARQQQRAAVVAERDAEDNEAPQNRITRPVSPQAQADASADGGLKRDAAIQSNIPAPNMPAPIQSFEGLGRAENIAAGFGNLSVPDTVGDVGPNHYVQQDNLLVRVWDKSGTPLTAPFKLSSLFTTLGGECAQPDRGNPLVLYDPLADRWMLSQFAFASQTAAPYHQCIAISKTGDPTGAYYLYDFVTAGNEFPEYPHLGVWTDGYYMTVNQFTLGTTFNGEGVYSFDRIKMLAGDPTAGYVYFNLSLANYPEVIGGMLPSDLDGLTPPPAGRPNTFVYFTTTDFGNPANGLRLFDFHADFTTPANSTFTERTESTYNAPLAVAPFSVVTPTGNQGRQAVPQPSPAAAASTALDAITDRLMHRLQYRNQGGYETLVLTHTVGAPASTTFGTFRAAPRYYELRSTASGPFQVQEQATYAPADGVSRWLASAAEDNQGNLAIGFNVSSGAAGGNVFPGIRYAGRLATDPAGGLFQGEATLIDGTGVQTSTGNRWGEYSALTVDPSDDCTFWYTAEYYTAEGQAASVVGWQTRIGSFKFPTCTAPPKGTAHFTITGCATASSTDGAIVTIDGRPYGVTQADGTLDATLAPGSHTYSITKSGSNVITGSFNITDGQTTNVSDCLASGSVHFVVTDCTNSDTVSGAAISINGNPVGSSAGDGTLDYTLAPGAYTYSISKFGYLTSSGSFTVADGEITILPVCVQGVSIIVANGSSIQSESQAPANSSIDPGETVTVNFTLRNDGGSQTNNLIATLQPTGGVTNPGGPATFGAIAGGGGTGTQPISFTADSGLTCGSTLTATLHLQDGENDLGNVTYTFIVCPIVMVTSTSGTTGPTPYATLKAAFDAINAGIHQGAINVDIVSSTTEGTSPATLNGSGAGSASYTSILIHPTSDGVSVSGNPANGLGVIQLNRASNVTIDGDNPNTAGTNRNLTIQNTAANTATFNSVVRIALSTGATTANNDTIKNLNLLGSATGRNTSAATSNSGSENTTYGILAAAGSTGPTSAPSAITSVTNTIGSLATASNLLIRNNSINSVARAIAVQGSATTVFPGLLIEDNVIGNPTSGAADQVYSVGITAQGTADGIISGNTLYLEGFVSTNVSGANQAISAGALSANTTLRIEKNRVARVHNRAGETWPAIGINLGGGNNHVVQNNFVYDIMNDQTNGFGGGATSFGAYGIRVASGTGHKVYHNTVHLFGTLPGTTSTDLTVAFIIVSTSQTGVDVRNNIFSNQITGGNPVTTSTRHAVIYLPSGASSAMNLTLNNNAYLQGTATTGALSLLAKVGTTGGAGQYFAADFVAGATTPATNLRSYTSTLSGAGTNDNLSLATDLPTQFTSDTDLHLPNGTVSPLESGGAGVGVTVDIDGQTRPGPPGSVNGGGTAPDLGADEFDGTVGPFPTPTPSPTPNPTPTPTPGPCASLSEGFDNIGTLPAAGWVQTNMSNPVGLNGWIQGRTEMFTSQSGAANSYIATDFNNTTDTNTISNWLLTPSMTLRDGNTLSFWTRTATPGATVFPDRLQVRMSLNGTSTNVGSSPTSVGDFTTLLLDINPTYTTTDYPNNWTRYTIILDGIGQPTVGRLAFRYFVEGGGPSGTRSEYIGIDSVELTCTENQTITFDALPDKSYGDPDFQVSATATSNLPVSFAASGNCTVTGDMVHLTGVGSCTITASQAGNSTFNPAPNVQRSFNIGKGTPVINWSNPADIIYGTALSATQLNATANVPGTFTYTPASGTVLSSGNGQNLHADFTPTDTTNYNNTSKDVSINVLTAVLNISMTADRNPAPVGLNFNYKPVISNTGNASATNVVLVDVLPSQVTYTAASASQGSCSYSLATHTVTCNLGTIPAGSSVNVQISVKPRDEGTLNNTASITGGQWDAATGNSSASVNGLPSVKYIDMSVQKIDSIDPIFVSQDTVYTITVKNNSTVLGATGVVMSDTLPAGLTFRSATTSQGSLITPPVGSTGVVTANLGSLATGATATITVTARGAASGVQTNVATVTLNETDPNTANNTASQATTVKDALLQKVLLASQVLIGGCQNTTGNVYLTGPAPAGGVVVALSSNVTGASVPVNVSIAAGQTVSPAFNVTTTPVAAKQVGLITAGSGQGAVSRGITINVGSGTCP